MTRQEYKEIYEVVGAAQEVHKTFGRGMHERIYQEAELMRTKIFTLMMSKPTCEQDSYIDV